jgi:hypothetical protein
LTFKEYAQCHSTSIFRDDKVSIADTEDGGLGPEMSIDFHHTIPFYITEIVHFIVITVRISTPSTSHLII